MTVGRYSIIVILLVLVLAACAPDNLDITPTPAPTPVPMIQVYVTGAVAQSATTHELPLGSRVQDALTAAGGTTETADLQQVNVSQLLTDGMQIHVPAVGEAAVATVEPTPEVVAVAGPRELVEQMIAAMEGTLPAGATNMRQDTTQEVSYIDREGGATGRVRFIDNSGNELELTYGVFDAPENALAWYDRQAESLNSQGVTNENPNNLPTPNLFLDSYTREAIFVRDNIFIRISVTKFSSTAGDPRALVARHAFGIVDQVLGTAAS